MWWLLLLWAGTAAAQSDGAYCLTSDPNPHLHFGTGTAYQQVYEKKLAPHVPGCKPVGIWMVGRHGTPYPSRERLEAMMDLHSLRDQVIVNHNQRRAGELCTGDLELLKTWRWNVPVDLADTLSPAGQEDMHYMAKRMNSSFPQILDQPYASNRYSIKYSDKETSRASAQAMAEELFGGDPSFQFSEATVDPYLSIGNCTRVAAKLKSRVLKKKVNIFRESQLASQLVHTVSRRLGFLYNLTLDTVWDIFDACRYGKAWDYKTTSPWCAAFSKSDLLVLDYMDDYENYYRYGYGNEISLKYACPIVKDLIETFDKLARNETEAPLGRWHIVDVGVLEAVMTRLGMAQDKGGLPLAKDISEVALRRQWRTAFIAPFAGNIAAIFYRCGGGQGDQVMFYINEHTVEYEGCRVGLCPWDYISSRFAPVVESPSCSEDLCLEAASPSERPHLSYFLILAAFTVAAL